MKVKTLYRLATGPRSLAGRRTAAFKFAPIVVFWAIGMTILPGISHAEDLNVPICYGFSCKTQVVINVTPVEWQSVVGWFSPTASSAADERQQIRKAIGWMEVIVGKHTPTYLDKGLNLEKDPQEKIGQMDCIDESKNTTTYLALFEQQGHLRWHRVIDPAYRRSMFDAHWAGQIQELQTSTAFVVDSWFQDNGMLPYIRESSEWKDLRWTALVSPYRD
ncbi:MAG: hypothetical protein VX749_06935 [Pseudomonadota bacterium]|nr:hypothetical protein [Pseudomonadota bacterium]